MAVDADDTTTLAPMARADLREEIHAQVEDALSRGAQLLTGGDAVEGSGFFYQATVLSGIKDCGENLSSSMSLRLMLCCFP